MAQAIIDLSGRGGLVSGFLSDADTLTSTPNRITEAEKNQMAGGMFNPWLKDGYLSPTVTNDTTVSKETLAGVLSATVYDPVTGITYFAGSNKIYTLDTNNDNSLALYKTLTSGYTIVDLEIYSIYGGRALFYTYYDSTDTDKAILFGADSLKTTGGIDVYGLPVADIDTKYAYSISTTSSHNLAQPFLLADSIIQTLDEAYVYGVRLKLRRTAGTYDWGLVVSLYENQLGTLGDASSSYVPITMVATNTIDPLTISTTTFTDVYVTFTSPVELTSESYSVVIEPDVWGDVVAGEEVLWLAGASANSTTSGIANDGTDWFKAKAGGLAKFDFSIWSDTLPNLIPVLTEEVIATNDALPIWTSGTTVYTSTAGTSHTASITVTTNANNIVFAFITTQGGSDVVTGVTVNGSAMTRLEANVSNSSEFGYVYYKTGVTNGTFNIVATTSGSVRSLIMSRVAYNVSSTIYSTTKKGNAFNQTAGGDAGVDDPQVVTAPAGSLAVQFYHTNWRNVSSSNYQRVSASPYNAGSLSVSSSEFPTLTTESGGNPGGRPSIVRTWNALSAVATLKAAWGTTQDEDNDAIGNQYSTYQIVLSPLTSTTSYTKSSLTGESSGRTFMRTADNNFMYLFSDNFVSIFDGEITGGPFGRLLPKAIVFHESVNVTDALDFRSRMYIAVSKYPVNDDTTSLSNFTGSAYLYVWDRLSNSLSTQDAIELPGVREVKKIYAGTDGALRLITVNDHGLTEVRRFGYNDAGGVVFPITHKLGLGSQPQVADGLVRGGENVYWLASNGRVFAQRDNAITVIKDVGIATSGKSPAYGQAIIPGAVAYVSSDDAAATYPAGTNTAIQSLVYSYRVGAGNSVEKRVYPMSQYPITLTGTAVAQTLAQGDVFTPVTIIPITSVARSIRVYNAPITGTGTSVVATVKVYFNQGSTAGITKTITKDEAKRGYVDFHINKPYIQAVQLEFEWPSATTFDADTYLPSIAVITYDETTTSSPDNG